jgi:formamidopyrimidine-DNA glycosylase
VPELPEVEVTRRHLAPAAVGRTVVRAVIVRARMARRNARPGDVAERLAGRRVLGMGRHGKFLVGELEGGLRWVMHLGMSGRIRIAGPAEPHDAHTNFWASMEGGREVRMVDPRTFGFVAVWTPEEWDASTMVDLGPDALDDLPPVGGLVGRLAGRTGPIKALLLDQRLLAGLGNIYADEVLARAGVHPARPAGSLSGAEVEAIHGAIGPVLAAGIQHGGTSLDDLAYLLPDGRAGEYLDRLRVYGRPGQPCFTCGAPIERIVVAQRSAHYCPSCQPR